MAEKMCYAVGSVYDEFVVYAPGGDPVSFRAESSRPADCAASTARSAIESFSPSVFDWAVGAHPRYVAPLLRQLIGRGAAVRVFSPSLLLDAAEAQGLGDLASAVQVAVDSSLVHQTPRSMGGLSVVWKDDELVAEMAYGLFDWTDSAMAALVQEHSIWPLLSYFSGIRPSGVARLMGVIGDPRHLFPAAMRAQVCPYDLLLEVCGVADARSRPSGARLAPLYCDAPVLAGCVLEDRNPGSARPEWALYWPRTHRARVAAAVGLVHRCWLSTLTEDVFLAQQLLAPELTIPDAKLRAGYDRHLAAAYSA